MIVPVVAVCILAGTWLGHFGDLNPNGPLEYIWFGGAPGVGVEQGQRFFLPLWFLLGSCYACMSIVFLAFGQLIGDLFSRFSPLRAYSVEILGSLIGIGLFGLLSFVETSQVVWMAVGAVPLLLLADGNWLDYAVHALCAIVVGAVVFANSSAFLWSPYYKIQFEPLTRITDVATGKTVAFPQPVGYALTVNNDYHQMLLNLTRTSADEHPFFTNWRRSYDAPYTTQRDLPPGPILVVGAGTGNDVAAALRDTTAEVEAVDMNPLILKLGHDFHFEKPYQDSRVHVVVNDAQ